jgi:hypothetical protein
MPSHEEKARRKALKNATRQAERDAIRSSLPLTRDQMRNLFDFVDQQLSENECDDTLRAALLFLEQQQLPVEPVVSWLRNNGGYCDCEALANAEERFLFAFPELDT